MCQAFCEQNVTTKFHNRINQTPKSWSNQFWWNMWGEKSNQFWKVTWDEKEKKKEHLRQPIVFHFRSEDISCVEKHYLPQNTKRLKGKKRQKGNIWKRWIVAFFFLVKQYLLFLKEAILFGGWDELFWQNRLGASIIVVWPRELVRLIEKCLETTFINYHMVIRRLEKFLHACEVQLEKFDF